MFITHNLPALNTYNKVTNNNKLIIINLKIAHLKNFLRVKE